MKRFRIPRSWRAWLSCGATAGLILVGCGTGTPAEPEESTDPADPNAPGAAIAEVRVTPSQLALLVGDTGRLAATPRTAAGDPAGGCTPSWESGSVAVAQVSPAGLVTGMGPGTTTIVAACGDVTGQATVTVAAVNAAVDTIFRDGFESGALGDAGRWQDIIGNFSIVNAAAEGISAPEGAGVMKIQPNGGAISHFVATGQTSPYERLRFAFSLYRKAGYADGGLRSGLIRGSTDQYGSLGIGGSCPDDPNNAPQQEFFITAVTQPSDIGWPLRMYNYWLGMQKDQTSPPLCYGTYAVGPGDVPQGVYHDPTFAPEENRWYRYEIELQLNTPGQSDGWEKILVDGVLKIEHIGVAYRSGPLTRIWAVSFDVGNTTVGTAYVDDVVVTILSTP